MNFDEGGGSNTWGELKVSPGSKNEKKSTRNCLYLEEGVLSGGSGVKGGASRGLVKDSVI